MGYPEYGIARADAAPSYFFITGRAPPDGRPQIPLVSAVIACENFINTGPHFRRTDSAFVETAWYDNVNFPRGGWQAAGAAADPRRLIRLWGNRDGNAPYSAREQKKEVSQHG